SSPYGSFSHSHGDQNAILLTVAGQPLLVKAGWYDWYGSPYWTDWYHQTKSQNAVTFDGGQGQLVTGYREQLQRNGKITSFSAQPTYDYVEGDATASYGGALTNARRQLWYLRGENAVIVRDKLQAPAAHNYEFNLHAPVAIGVESPSSVKIAAGGQMVCVRSLGAGAAWEKRVGYAPKAGTFEDHGAFTLKAGAKAPAEFLVLLDVGCRRPAVKVVASGSGASAMRTVTVGSQYITLY
ncbi:MAG: heparinase II/III family protein, partial [Massilia sp.]